MNGVAVTQRMASSPLAVQVLQQAREHLVQHRAVTDNEDGAFVCVVAVNQLSDTRLEPSLHVEQRLPRFGVRVEQPLGPVVLHRVMNCPGVVVTPALKHPAVDLPQPVTPSDDGTTGGDDLSGLPRPRNRTRVHVAERSPAVGDHLAKLSRLSPSELGEVVRQVPVGDNPQLVRGAVPVPRED